MRCACMCFPATLNIYGMCETDMYVADELMTARSKQRIRIGNTDAEGRMSIVDALCEAKEAALTEINPELCTIATLTEHVVLSYGDQYSAVMCNRPAKESRVDVSLQECGDLIADPFETRRIEL